MSETAKDPTTEHHEEPHQDAPDHNDDTEYDIHSSVEEWSQMLASADNYY